jgi:hypothetical protein
MMGSHAPANLADATWLTTCRTWAARLHAGNVTIGNGWWQCDSNMPGWFAAARVEDSAGHWLAGYKYLRSFTFQIHKNPPALACDAANHKKREPGTGALENRTSRKGVLDKLYDPTLLARAYVNAVSGGMNAITDNQRAIKARGGALVEVDDQGVETDIP